MLLVFGLENHDDVILALILGDPLYGSAFVTMAASSGPLHLPGDPTVEVVFLWGVVWLVLHSVAAALLFRATLATFDRCLGRIPEVGRRPVSGRPGRSSRAPAKPLALVLSSEDEL